MATVCENMTNQKECFSFTLILNGFDELTTEIETALYVACDDAMLGIHAGTPYLAFDREADSLEHAITSAIKSVEGCYPGIQVTRVIPPGADTIATINAYLRLRRQLMTQMPAGLPKEVIEKIDDVMDAIVEMNPEIIRQLMAVK